MKAVTLVVVLLALPVAGAQALPGPVLHLEDIDVAKSVDPGLANVTVFAALECPMDYPDPTLSYMLYLEVSSEDDVVFSGPATKVVSEACYNLAPTSSKHLIPWPLTMDTGNITADTNIRFAVHLWAEESGMGLYGEPDDVEGSATVHVNQTQSMRNLSSEPPIPEAQTTPGPALPLLLAALVAVVSRRR